MKYIVSVIIPCVDERDYINRCLDSFSRQTLNFNDFEVIVVDGMSVDGTREIINKYVNQYPNFRLIDNQKKNTPAALNLGVQFSIGIYVVIFGAHSYAEPDFLENGLKTFSHIDADCVGGTIATLGGSDNAKAIALAMSSPFGVGNALFRYSKKAQYVDTVAFGMYKREVFNKVGYFDETLIRTQDAEFNYRLIRSGGKIYLNPDIRAFYYCRNNLLKLIKQYYNYGQYKVRVIEKHKSSSSIRQLVPAIFIIAILLPLAISSYTPKAILLSIGVAFSHFIANIIYSYRITIDNDLPKINILPFAFLFLHVSFGVGFIKGIGNIFIRKLSINYK